MHGVRYLYEDKSGRYFFRFELPIWFQRQHPGGLKRIFISLKTKDLHLARLRLAKIAAYTRATLKKFRMTKSGGGVASRTISQMIRDYRDYVEEADPHEQEGLYWGQPQFGKILEHYEEQLRYLKKAGILKYVEPDFSNVDELVKRAERAAKKKNNKNIAGKLGENEAQPLVHVQPVGSSSEAKTKSQITISEVLKVYIEDMPPSNVQTTRDKARSHIGFLMEICGDIPIADFNEEHFRLYRRSLSNRTRMKAGVEVPTKKQTLNEHLTSCNSLFSFARTMYDRSIENYFEGKGVKFKVTSEDKDIPVPFSPSELVTMFSHSIFTEGKYLHPYQYWAPLLALVTGCRENEIAQLRTSDIRQEDGIWYISINLETDDKKIKTKKARDVPIHPKLIELGFIEFAKLFDDSKYQWEPFEESHRIFRGLSLDKTRGGYKRNLGRWFNGDYDKKKGKQSGFKHQLGFTFHKNEKKDFHSFRHTLSTMLQQADVDWNISHFITGHLLDESNQKALSGAGARYRHGYTMEQMNKAICKLDFDDILANVKPFFDLNGEKKCRRKVKPGRR